LSPLFILIGCGRSDDAQKIVDKAIRAHGGDLYDRMYLEFDFRGRQYTAKRKNGLFTYTREFEDSSGRVKDILTNNHFVRTVNGDTVNLAEKKAEAYKNSVNSVIYFALLPQALNDPSVIKELLGETRINHRYYYKIKVTFEEKGGGKDHEDVFIYWFDKENFSMDYFAYLFFSDGGGIRFREAIDTKKIKGIVLSDYKNYALNDVAFDITSIDSLYLNGRMDLLSEIHLENVNLILLDDEK